MNTLRLSTNTKFYSLSRAAPETQIYMEKEMSAQLDIPVVEPVFFLYHYQESYLKLEWQNHSCR